VQNEAEAAGYFKLAADQHHVDAQFHYALCLEDGRVVVQSDDDAARYFKLAADQNHASTQFSYGLRLEEVEALHRMRPRLLDISNLLQIRMMHHSKTVTPFSLRLGEAL
jgi:TPR repeat protein